MMIQRTSELPSPPRSQDGADGASPKTARYSFARKEYQVWQNRKIIGRYDQLQQAQSQHPDASWKDL